MKLSPTALRWARFVAGGALNTAISYAIFLAANLVLPYQAAYLIAYLVGIAFSYWFNAVFVFQTTMRWRRAIAYPSVYIVQYGVGALLLAAFVEAFGMTELAAPLVVAVCLIPVTYALTRLILLRGAKADA
jgi:putative flippase GtrA